MSETDKSNPEWWVGKVIQIGTEKRVITNYDGNSDTLSHAPYNPHPWLTNLRDMMKMLDDEIKIPHLLDGFDKNGSPCYLSGCDECLDALKLRNQYLQRKQSQLQ